MFNGWTKNSPYYNATARARTHEPPLPLAMNKESHALPMWPKSMMVYKEDRDKQAKLFIRLHKISHKISITKYKSSDKSDLS